MCPNSYFVIILFFVVKKDLCSYIKFVAVNKVGELFFAASMALMQEEFLSETWQSIQRY